MRKRNILIVRNQRKDSIWERIKRFLSYLNANYEEEKENQHLADLAERCSRTKQYVKF